MVSISMKELLESGVHFGHQTKRWNPKMKEYIFGQRNGIYIIDLQQTLKLFQEASDFITRIVSQGKHVLFVGTKRQAQEAILEESQKCRMFCVTQRWLGGLLTNFTTIQKSIERLREMDTMAEEGHLEQLSKKERAAFERERYKREKIFSGVKSMSELPGALFVVDIRKEKIAVHEARKLKIPVIAIVDTNCDPDDATHLIPGNDDAIRAIKLFSSKIADAVLEGLHIYEEMEQERQKQIELDRMEEEKKKALLKTEKPPASPKPDTRARKPAARKPETRQKKFPPVRKKAETPERTPPATTTGGKTGTLKKADAPSAEKKETRAKSDIAGKKASSDSKTGGEAGKSGEKSKK